MQRERWLRYIQVSLGAASVVLCLCGVAAGVMSWRATDLHHETWSWPRPWVEVSPSLSADGRYVTFEVCRDTRRANPPRAFGRRGEAGHTDLTDVVVADLQSHTTRTLSKGVGGRETDDSSFAPRIDGRGDWVVFASTASNLIASAWNSVCNVYLYDTRNQTCVSLSASLDDEELKHSMRAVAMHTSFSPAISLDGRRVAFVSYGLDAYGKDQRGRSTVVWDRGQGKPRCILFDTKVGPCYGRADFSPDGNRVAFACFAPDLKWNSVNLGSDILVCQLSTPSRSRNSVGMVGEFAHSLRRQSDAVAVASTSVDGSSAHGSSYTPVLSDDCCAFASQADNLTEGDTNGGFDVFLRDLPQGRTERISVSSRGEQANEESFEPSISRDGRFVAFSSYASNLDVNDTNGTLDVFLRDRRNHTTRLISRTPRGTSANGPSYNPCISADGSHVAYVSLASDLEASATARGQVYVWDRITNRTVRVPVTEE